MATAPSAPSAGGSFDFDAALAGAPVGGGFASDVDMLPVYFGQRPGPESVGRGPAVHADTDSSIGAPTDRGPAMHFDPSPAPWQDMPEGGEKTTPLGQAKTMIYRDGVQERFVDLLLKNGIIERGNYSWDDIEGWWQVAVEGAAKAWKYGGKKVTPYEWLELWHGSGMTGAGGPETRTSVEKSFTEIDDLDARAAAEEAYGSLLGRAPKGKEASAVHAALQAYAKAHPSITRRTTTDDGEGNVTSKSTTSGGMSAAAASQIVEDEARSQPGYAEYQAATTYFNALQSALGATADV